MKMSKSVQKSTKQRRLLIIGVAAEVVILVILSVVLVRMNLSNIDQTVATEHSVDRTLVNDDMEKLPHDTYNYMLRHLHDDGTYDYEINLDTGELSSSYNLMRHTGSTWGLLEAYPTLKNSDADLTKIQTAVDYLSEKIEHKDDDTAYIIRQNEGDGINKVAENALGLLVFLKLHDITHENRHLELARHLANGLLEMQTESGQYYHKMNDVFTGSGLEKGIMYDGEIDFALIRIYESTGEDRYINAVKKSLNFLRDDDYLMRRDQWLSYVQRSLLEMGITDYAESFLANLKRNIKTVDDDIWLCDMEFLGNSYRFVETLMEHDGIVATSHDELLDLLEEIKGVYYRRAVKGVRTLLASEKNGIENPDYYGAFTLDGRQARIDLSQHNLTGYLMFYDYFYSTESPDALARYAEVRIKPREGENPYVALARRAVETYVRTRETISVPDGLPSEMTTVNQRPKRIEGQPRFGGYGVYVTIKNNGKLRGCIGSYFATEDTLAQEIIKQAIGAATNDARMKHVSAGELDALSYEVSILDKIEKVEDLSELDPEKYGILLTQEGKKQALMLPGVESIGSVEEQVEKTLKKGNLKRDDNYSIWRFTTTKYE